LIDSNNDLGVNAKAEDRFQVRFLHHCAPIVTEGFSRLEIVNNTEMMRYYYAGYGEEVQANFTQEMFTDADNSYQEYGTHKARARANYGISQVQHYKKMNPTDWIRVLKAYGGPLEQSRPSWCSHPIQQLAREDADVILWFLSAKGLTFTDEADDPIFSAQQQGPRKQGLLNDTQSKPSYLHDGPLTVLACSM
jgi:hypothetical protein